MKKRVLFVCLGNICRSPAAEGIMLEFVKRAKLEHLVEVDSAGTGAWHIGEAPDDRMIRHARQRGYDLSQLVGRQITAPDDFAKFDYILTMDNANLRDVRALDREQVHHHKIQPLVEYCRIHSIKEVPDPYYKDETGFEHVLDLLEDACTELLNKIQRELA